MHSSNSFMLLLFSTSSTWGSDAVGWQWLMTVNFHSATWFIVEFLDPLISWIACLSGCKNFLPTTGVYPLWCYASCEFHPFPTESISLHPIQRAQILANQLLFHCLPHSCLSEWGSWTQSLVFEKRSQGRCMIWLHPAYPLLISSSSSHLCILFSSSPFLNVCLSTVFNTWAMEPDRPPGCFKLVTDKYQLLYFQLCQAEILQLFDDFVFYVHSCFGIFGKAHVQMTLLWNY